MNCVLWFQLFVPNATQYTYATNVRSNHVGAKNNFDKNMAIYFGQSFAHSHRRITTHFVATFNFGDCRREEEKECLVKLIAIPLLIN